ncbi:MAG: hypothetical protein NT014_05630 [Candidatus Omnitrophica bacterium]|nr:hypothetical protein [Candidatus Omnitrophota bacterium]
MLWKTATNDKAKNTFSAIYFLLLFILLLSVSFPSLSYPPLSDYWEIFYFFHHLDKLPGLSQMGQWLHCLNTDPIEQMSYRPLFGLYYYLIHLLFGSNYVLFNIFNAVFYFLTIYLLYKFSLEFSRNKLASFVFIGLFAFLFSHFDMLLWSFQTHIMIGFSMSLAGFMVYLRYLRTSKPILLGGTIVFLLGAMLCYEPFFLWPLVIIILSSIKKFKPAGSPDHNTIIKSNSGVLGAIYSIYFLFYVFTRALGTYIQPTHKISYFFNLSNSITAGFLAAFNIFYGLLLDFFPFLAFPLKVTENIYMSGPLVNYIASGHKEVIFIVGSLCGLILGFFLVFLYRRKLLEELKVLGLFLFLMLAEIYAMFFCRLAISELEYGLTEFRYQYIPNAFMVLIAIFLADRFGSSFKYKKLIYPLLAIILIFNVFCIRLVVDIYTWHLAPLNTMLSNIKQGINKGAINQNNKLYIDRDMPDYLPHLCWNIGLGERFILEGNYQWIFPRRQLEYFTGNPQEAVWIINKDDFGIARKGQAGISLKAQKINSLGSKWYKALGKDQAYLQTGYIFKNRGDYKQAAVLFRKAIEMEPQNQEAQDVLVNLYNFDDGLKK